MRRSTLLTPLALIGFLTTGACSSSTEQPPGPEGLTLTESGFPVVIVAGTNVTGSLSIVVGRTSTPIVVTFRDSEGTAVETQGRYLETTTADSNIASFEVTDAAGFTGKLRGSEAGNTTVRFRLMDGVIGSGTLVYESPPIPVQVEDKA